MLELGVLIGGVTVLALLLLGPIFRQPVPPRWTQNGLISEAVTVMIVSGFALALVMIVSGAIETARTGVSLPSLGVLAGVIVVLALAWRLLRPRPVAGPGTGRLPTGTA